MASWRSSSSCWSAILLGCELRSLGRSTVTRQVLPLAIVLPILGGIAFAFVKAQHQVPRAQVYKTQAWTVSPPATYTAADEVAYMEAAANGDPFPAGWTEVSDEGEVTGTLTGLVDPRTLDRQITVSVRDDDADLDTASLYLSGAQVCVATRATGSVVERDGQATATMSTFVPAHPPCALEVKWLSASGVELSHRVSW